MTVTVVTRHIVPDVPAAVANAKIVKALWIKHGAKDFRVNQILTGPYTGQYIVSVMFSDFTAYAKARTAYLADPKAVKAMAKGAKIGAVLVEREFLVSVDV